MIFKRIKACREELDLREKVYQATDVFAGQVVSRFPDIDRFPAIFLRAQCGDIIFRVVYYNVYGNYSVGGCEYSMTRLVDRLDEAGLKTQLSLVGLHTTDDKYGCVHGSYDIKIVKKGEETDGI